jgi:hypothetical protein
MSTLPGASGPIRAVDGPGSCRRRLVIDPLSARADVSVVVVADGGEPELTVTVRSVLGALADARSGGGRAGGGWLRGERLGGELVLVVRDVAALPAVLRSRSDDLVRVVAAPGTDAGRARNLGIAAARGRYLLFTGPEVRVPREWVLTLTAPLRAGTADLVAGPVRLADDVRPADLDPEVEATLLDALRDPRQPVRVLSGLNMAVSRAVFEAVGFDEALGTARYPHADASVFGRDVVGAGFRELTVDGAPVERRPDPGALRTRALTARARAHGRGAAYLDRHLYDVRPPLVAGGWRVLGRALALTGLVLRRARPGALLAAHAALAHRHELVRLRRTALRATPQSAAGDVPGGAGAPRAARPVTLVGRSTVTPTTLPPVPAAARSRPADAPGRGSVYALWGPHRSVAAGARAAAPPVAGPLHGSAAS